MVYVWLIFVLLWTIINAGEIELLECEPPDVPRSGGYGPHNSYYVPGDVVHYYCHLDAHIGGNYHRRCEDTGDWSGDTPVCDIPSTFSFVNQTTILDAESGADRAVDGLRTTCTSTKGYEKGEWSGTFTTPGELIRVMLFLPKGPVSYAVVLVKSNGDELICGSQSRYIDRYDWTFHNCPGPNNIDAVGLKIRSLTTAPLQICEIQAYVLSSPKCMDPHERVESGHIVLDRKLAVLVCDYGFTKSKDYKLECLRDGQWKRKRLYCTERQWVLHDKPSAEPRSSIAGKEIKEI